MTDEPTGVKQENWDVSIVTVSHSETHSVYSDRYWLAVYAGQAMQGMLADPERHPMNDDDVVTYAYRFAAAMLAEKRRLEADNVD